MKLYDNDSYRDEFMNGVYALLSSDQTSDRANQIIDLFDLAPAVEATMEPSNDPLTPDELRQMDGEPVWVTFDGSWRLCYGLSDYRGYLCMETGNGSCILMKDYGEKWLAYRHKPEGTNTS